MDNLPELRDIHIPDGVSAFPPAYGWWLILLAIIATIVLVKLYSAWRIRSKKLYALRLLNDVRDQDVILAAKEMSEILRRICVIKYPEASVYIGKEWIDFLNLHTKETIGGKTAQLLIDAPYVRPHSKNYSQEDLENLRAFCVAWIGENL